jgi:hypothetical protein
MINMTLPKNSDERKNVPVALGALGYFPAAIAGVARHSKIGNDKHNPGEAMHHARGKSTDHEDCIARHLLDIMDMCAHIERANYEVGADTIRALLDEANALSWRALALSQVLHEKFDGAPLAPCARNE